MAWRAVRATSGTRAGLCWNAATLSGWLLSFLGVMQLQTWPRAGILAVAATGVVLVAVLLRRARFAPTQQPVPAGRWRRLRLTGQVLNAALAWLLAFLLWG